MSPLMSLNLATLTVMKAGVFHGCPPKLGPSPRASGYGSWPTSQVPATRTG